MKAQEKCAVTHTFDSLGALLERVALPLAPGLEGYAERERERDEWSGNLTLREAVAALAGKGSPEMAERVRATTVEAHVPTRTESHLTEAYGVSGGAVDVQRFLEGDPECMIDYASPAGIVSVVDIVVGMGGSAGVPADWLMRRGAAVVAHIDALEAAGTRVRLYWEMGLPEIGFVGLVKDYHAALDLDLVAFVLVHPAFFRKVMFHVARTYEAIAEVGGGLGAPSCPEVPTGALHIPSVRYDRYLGLPDPCAWVATYFQGAAQ